MHLKYIFCTASEFLYYNSLIYFRQPKNCLQALCVCKLQLCAISMYVYVYFTKEVKNKHWMDVKYFDLEFRNNNMFVYA